MMRNIHSGYIYILAVIFVLIGGCWAIAPQIVSAQVGMDLLIGVGLSSQIGDLAALFLSLGIFIIMGLRSGERVWFLAPAIILGLVAIFRIDAWLFHDAALTTLFIVGEIVSAIALATYQPQD